MNETEIISRVVDSAIERDGTKILACARALALAEALQVAPREIGRICNENDIRIAHCQLGCFA